MRQAKFLIRFVVILAVLYLPLTLAQVDAAVVERLVNDAVARHLPFGVPCEHRASFYAELLERVDIAQACALVFTWRAGQPASGREAAARPVMGAAR